MRFVWLFGVCGELAAGKAESRTSHQSAQAEHLQLMEILLLQPISRQGSKRRDDGQENLREFVQGRLCLSNTTVLG